MPMNLIEEITKFRASDGREFSTRQMAEAWQARVDLVEKIDAELGFSAEPDRIMDLLDEHQELVEEYYRRRGRASE